MNLPGFTAELVISKLRVSYHGGLRYRMTSSPDIVAARMQGRPNLMSGPRPFGTILNGSGSDPCICVEWECVEWNIPIGGSARCIEWECTAWECRL